VLTHAPGETADQLWVAVPTRRIVVAAGMFQPFLPNARNGRAAGSASWAAGSRALRDMAALEPLRALPMHGPALVGSEEIARRFTGQARMMETVAEQTLAALNSGVRKYDAAQGVARAAGARREPRCRRALQHAARHRPHRRAGIHRLVERVAIGVGIPRPAPRRRAKS
jgi:glyoxylase-like metal-dependent hydrolase (beta-lactamase superfamily II)